MIRIEVPFLPPSVNHYKVPNKYRGMHKTSEAKNFETYFDIVLRSIGGSEVGDSFKVTINAILGEGVKGDADNWPKMILDGLARNGMFVSRKGKVLSDNYVDDLHVMKDRFSRPKTSKMQITIEGVFLK